MDRTGNGNTTSSVAPVQVSNLAGVAGIALGNQHSCAFTADGTVWCWGSNDKGQLGNGSVNSPVPIMVQGL
jgi:alpha-tubulin suppressor-like RCC1 family protein